MDSLTQETLNSWLKMMKRSKRKNCLQKYSKEGEIR